MKIQEEIKCNTRGKQGKSKIILKHIEIENNVFKDIK